MKRKSYIFGPVPSRRLGFSLGVDITPYKTCTLDCVYCQLGATTDRTVERKNYVPAKAVLNELKTVLDRGERIDYITFSGSGEPTLNFRIGEMIRRVKEITAIPVAVLTNGTLLYDSVVREELAAADLVVPSLDAGTEAVFQKVNRPHPGLSLEKLVQGTADFTAAFPGKVWLEVMLVRGVNDDKKELAEIARQIKIIRPERVQLNTVVRPAAEKGARSLDPAGMEAARSFLQSVVGRIPVEVVTSFTGEEREKGGGGPEAVAEYLKRRPGTLEDLAAALGIHRNVLVKYLARLVESGDIREEFRDSKKYFMYK